LKYCIVEAAGDAKGNHGTSTEHVHVVG